MIIQDFRVEFKFWARMHNATKNDESLTKVIVQYVIHKYPRILRLTTFKIDKWIYGKR